MKAELQKAKKMLESRGYTCVLCRKGEVYTSMERGIKPLLTWIDSGTNLRGAYAADQIVGKAAAMLYAVMGVKGVYAPFMSEAAVRMLARHDIIFAYDGIVQNIINRSGTGPCPMEETVKDIEDPQKGYAALLQKVAQMKQ